MSKKKKIKWMDEEIEVEDLDFEIVKESPNEYRTENGAIIKVRLVAVHIFKALEKKTEEGEPLYIVRSTNIVTSK